MLPPAFGQLTTAKIRQLRNEPIEKNLQLFIELLPALLDVAQDAVDKQNQESPLAREPIKFLSRQICPAANLRQNEYAAKRAVYRFAQLCIHSVMNRANEIIDAAPLGTRFRLELITRRETTFVSGGIQVVCEAVLNEYAEKEAEETYSLEAQDGSP